MMIEENRKATKKLKREENRSLGGQNNGKDLDTSLGRIISVGITNGSSGSSECDRDNGWRRRLLPHLLVSGRFGP